MSGNGLAGSDESTRPKLLPGQTVMFLGDHTSPDDAGYVRVIRSVLERFHPRLGLKLISAGSPGQTAGGVGLSALLDLLASSRPDWVSIGVGLADAWSDPALPALLREYRPAEPDDDEEPGQVSRAPRPEVKWHAIERFRGRLSAAVAAIQGAGMRCVLATTVLVGNDLAQPANLVLQAYSRAIRDVAEQAGAPVSDHERAFRAVLDRAKTYKQRVALATEAGQVNHQGEALLARTFLATFGVLPHRGQRPLR